MSFCKDLEWLLLVFDIFPAHYCLQCDLCFQMSRLNRLAYGNIAGFNKSLLYQTMSMSPELAFAAGINGARSDHKVAMPSSSLAAIPEGTATSATSGPGVPSTSSAVPSSSGASKLSSSARTHQQSTQTTGTVLSGSTAAVQDVSRSSVVADGRSSSPKHSAGGSSIVGAAASRMQAVDNVVPPTVTAATSIKGPRLLFVVRHGERIDFTFGKDWMQNSFNFAGLYYCAVYVNGTNGWTDNFATAELRSTLTVVH